LSLTLAGITRPFDFKIDKRKDGGVGFVYRKSLNIIKIQLVSNVEKILQHLS
jgi:hypothetical protein